MGMRYAQVERDLPTFGPPFKLHRSPCYQLTVQSPTSNKSRWSFLQRLPDKSNEFAGPWPWRLLVKEGSLPEGGRRILQEVASDWEFDFLEFERAPGEISAFCGDETLCSEDLLRRVHACLIKLSSAS